MSASPTRSRRKKGPYFERQAGAPAPLTIRVKRTVLFSDADPMGVLWHGRYAAFFESAAAELHRACGLGYLDYREAGIEAPIVQLHIDYVSSLLLEEEATIEAKLVWNDAARIDTEYTVTRPDGQLAAKGYTIQLFTSATTRVPLLAPPAFVERVRQQWINGEFAALQ